MFPDERWRRLKQMADRYRVLGAASLKKAVTLEQLGVPNRIN